MSLPSPRWLKAVFLSTVLIFASVAVYVYGFAFGAWIESDAAVTAVLAAKALQAKLPVVDNWYYANGDVWLVAAHLIAMLPVAVIGLGVPSLLVAVAGGFLLELYAFTRAFARLGGEHWVGLFAAMVTMMAWSTAHVAFGYIQLAYGFLTCLCVLSFVTFAALAESAVVRLGRWVVAGLLVAAIGAQNPTRTLAFIYGPVVIGCLWPWRGVALRRRLTIVGVATAGWALAFVIYAFVFSRFVSFSMPRGHLDFKIVDAFDGLLGNLAYLGKGLTVLCGGGGEPSLLSVPGSLVMAGALVMVVREVLSSRAYTALRFVAVVVLAQLGVVLLPVLLGNLLVDVPSVRYLMPSLLETLGLAAILAVRALGDAGMLWRKLATCWLIVLPLTALLAVRDVRPPVPTTNVWPNSVELERVAGELVRRNLTRGYADVLAANLVTLQTGGVAMVCPIHFVHVLMPLRWLTDTTCYDGAKLPDRLFVVAYKTEQARTALRATLPPPVETFSAGDTYDVHVFRTADTSLAWLALPLPENDKNAFPLRLAATHLQLRPGAVALESGRMVATGENGAVIYGPYIALPPGRYTVRWYGSGMPSPGAIGFYVSADGKDKLAETRSLAEQLPMSRGQLAELEFELKRPRSAIELVVYSQDGGRVAFDELVIERR